ncbi:MAG: ankyrin repeat domain-containing protein [Polaromonas sp.]|nr:ankyrin repeat domain-containing protein [Polaromonas sp.]
MTENLMYYLKKLVFLIVFAGFSAAHAGSYEDFFRAIMRNDERVIQQLLNKGFDANTPDEYGRPGLLVAIEETSARVSTVLVNWPKTDMNALNAKGESALMLASISGQVTMASQLIQRGADVNKTGWTPLHYAASKGHVAVISLLLENHAYIDAPSPNGTTPLMMAAMYGTGAAVKLLLDQGADPNLKNQQGLTAFNFAENGERPDAIKLLTPAAPVRGVIRATGQW